MALMEVFTFVTSYCDCDRRPLADSPELATPILSYSPSSNDRSHRTRVIDNSGSVEIYKKVEIRICMIIILCMIEMRISLSVVVGHSSVEIIESVVRGNSPPTSVRRHPHSDVA